MGNDETGAPKTDSLIRGAKLTAYRRAEKLAMIGYRMAVEAEATDYKSLLKAITSERDMEKVAIMAVSRSLSKGQGGAFFAMAQLFRALTNGDEYKQGGVVGAIIRTEYEAEQKNKGSQDGPGDRAGDLDGESPKADS